MKSHLNPYNWTKNLPLVLLGIWSSLKEDVGCTAAELVYGTSLQLPGGYFSATDSTFPNPLECVQHLKTVMSRLRAVPPRPHPDLIFYVNLDLFSGSHVFVCHDAIRKPLQSPYGSPYQVINRMKKYFPLDVNGKQEIVSVDPLKAAHVDATAQLSVSQPQPTSPLPTSTPSSTSWSTPTAPSPHSPQQAAIVTRSGRHVHWPDCLTL